MPVLSISTLYNDITNAAARLRLALPVLAAELVSLKVDVIVTDDGTVPTLAAKNATRTVPIVFPAVADPVGTGLVANLARPGGNLTGLSLQSSDTAGKRADALIVFPDAMFVAQSARIATLAAKHKLPTMGDNSALPESGGLASYGANRLDMLRRAAILVDKILKGAKPATLPIEQPSKFDSILNLKTAKALGLKIPEAILLRADRVIASVPAPFSRATFAAAR